MRCLITGGAGFVGSHLAEELMRRERRVHVLDDLSTGAMDNIRHLKDHPGFSYTVDSAAEPGLVAELVDDADVVFHLAAAVGVELIVESPVRTIETNVHCTEVVLAAANKKRKPVFLASTSGSTEEWRPPIPRGWGPSPRSDDKGPLVIRLFEGHRRISRARVLQGTRVARGDRTSARPTLNRGTFGAPAVNGAVMLRAEDGIGGIATSAFNGRSFTLGIADSVTVVAASAAAADAAATVVANAVDLDSPAIERRPARALDPDSDLGDRLVTSAVGPLTEAEIRQALTNGRSRAARLIARGLIGGAALIFGGKASLRQRPRSRRGSRPRPGILKSRHTGFFTLIPARILTLPIVCVRMILC